MTNHEMDSEEAVRESIRKQYGAIARGGSPSPNTGSGSTGPSESPGAGSDAPTAASCCCAPSCCEDGKEAADPGNASGGDYAVASEAVGYTAEQLAILPGGADLGLGSGNPVAAAELQPGETVLDLGSGGGIDCFLAAHEVGPRGRVIGVDMTPEMLARARTNLEETDFSNVEFRPGEIEALPVADASVNVILSNCVINLSPNRSRVLAEAFRVLKRGGRLVISDLVSEETVPPAVATCASDSCACLPVPRDEYLSDLEAAGFTHGAIDREKRYPAEALTTRKAVEKALEVDPLLEDELEGFVDSVKGAIIEARKPHSVESAASTR